MNKKHLTGMLVSFVLAAAVSGVSFAMSRQGFTMLAMVLYLLAVLLIAVAEWFITKLLPEKWKKLKYVFIVHIVGCFFMGITLFTLAAMR